MTITEVRVRRLYNEARLRAVVSVTLDNALAIHDIKVIEGPERFFVAMPSRREPEGGYRDIVHPISAEMRHQLEDAVMKEYHETVTRQEENPDHPVDHSEKKM
ncbi:septation regulator SpoVG [Solibaculum mannosilyticum]|uniref:Putative septation protein SpoVG n=1 Tax=Solibaculum mannosilyticum TaxID=2780922 RepID=A0A7I8D158_9FIRM|nr:septation regulator SpoVG [Solibaculum mannosilyticum]MCO7137787.1 septation regulator SpoVG [[Clostridium] leptum]BCI60528.1 putative septation protein SpoVG [Solibaculum mannosilyticum]CZT56982.1 Putative septation protein SpoVG [Eubacteriaceae bacterium CHKCI005]